jgi:adenylylsulfate kinase-like enzyme
MNGVVVWMTGVERAGKTTLARALSRQLAPGRAVLLDEEEFQAALGQSGSIDLLDGEQLYGPLARVSALLARQGFVVLVAAATRREEHRSAARAAAPRFIEVHVAGPCEQSPGHGVHGLYFSSRAEPHDERYRPPCAPDVIARGGHDEVALRRLLTAIEAYESIAARAPR